VTTIDNASRPFPDGAASPLSLAPRGAAGVFPKLKAVASSTLCDMAGCRKEWDVRLQEGASLLNPGKTLKFCSSDWKAFLDEESKMRAKYEPGRQVTHTSKMHPL
jgi:hypothetical protein